MRLETSRPAVRTRLLSFSFVVAMLICLPAEAGSIIYVNAAATGAHTGQSWPDAFTDLQPALQAARDATGTITEIWVAAGTYRPAPPNGDRALSFRLVSSVGLYGGFAGAESTRDQRNPQANLTILSGDLNGDDGPNFTNYAENSYAVVVAIGVHSTTTLDGFTLSSGNGDSEDYNTYLGSAGAGIYCEDSNPRLLNCTIQRNQADGAWAQAGGMHNRRSSPDIDDCTFVENTGWYGGAMANFESSSPRLRGCVFTRNAASAGAGIYNYYGCDPELTNCSFVNNSGTRFYWGAGGGLANFGHPTLIGCDFVTNVADYDGGAIAGSDVTLLGCMFTDNTAREGGALAGVNQATNCVFLRNRALTWGGGVQGGGMFLNCTFSGNTAGTAGGSIFVYYDQNAAITNCIMWGNSRIDGTDEPAQLSVAGTVTVNYSCVQGWAGPGAGNLVKRNPLFMDPAIGDLRLLPGSPCIDAGDAESVQLVGLSTDFQGNPRLVNDPNVPNTGNPADLGFVDMGAFETQPDCNANGIDDHADIAAGTSVDCNANGYPDECEPQDDCNLNGEHDICDLASGAELDCNHNLSPDTCDIAAGASRDCNGNSVPDECDFTAGRSQDCNGNGKPDECDITAHVSRDANGDGVPDECEPDCNANGSPDDLDIGTGHSPDANDNGIPDECESPILYVRKAATGRNSGVNWQDALTSLSQALTIARVPTNTVHEIWVASGTYTPDPSGLSDHRQATFSIMNGLSLLGGFAGTETSRDQRNPRVNLTVVSGDLNNDDGPGGTKITDNCYHVVTLQDTDSSTLLEGITVIGGNAQYYTGGGGIVITNSGVNNACNMPMNGPVIKNCTITANTGGIYNTQAAPLIVNCIVRANRSGSSATVYSSYGRPVLINCLIEQNATIGFSISDGCNSTLINCTIANNLGTGVYQYNYYESHIINCIIWGNRVSSPYPVDVPRAQIFGVSPNPNVTYSCIEGNDGRFGTIGNTGVDPLFVDPDGPDNIPGTADDVFRLKAHSPCIDAGNNDSIPSEITTDLQGIARRLDNPFTTDTGHGQPPLVDMGAFEFDFDVDHDGIADISDNCPRAANPDQLDSDHDGLGDTCDACPFDADNDADHDGVCGDVDYCPGDTDLDFDHVCDRSDNCPHTANSGQEDADHDGVGDACDECPATPPGMVVGPNGCSNLRGDFDQDGDLDQSDFGRLQACMNLILANHPECALGNMNTDTFINPTDTALFIKCMSGPDIVADPHCTGP